MARLTYDSTVNTILDIVPMVFETDRGILVEHLKVQYSNGTARIETLKGEFLGRVEDDTSLRTLLKGALQAETRLSV